MKMQITPKGQSSWEFITPETATELLELNTHNYRNVSPASVAKLVQTMKAGQWEPNAEAIVINEDGILVDGQHRLHAVIESGVSVWMMVTRGVSRECKTWNNGRNRTEQEHARAAGLDASARVLSLAKYMIMNKWLVQPRSGYLNRDKRDDYVRNHIVDINTALSCVTLSQMSTRGGKTLNRLYGYLLVYLLLRNGYSEEKMRQFCTIYNGGIPEPNVEPSSALVVSRQYMMNIPATNDSTAMGETMANIGCAMEDFAAGVRRTYKYQQTSVSPWTPEKLEALWHRIRKIDGIE